MIKWEHHKEELMKRNWRESNEYDECFLGGYNLEGDIVLVFGKCKT